jgi:endonuclease YncB( thermonuclease family)
MEFPKLLNAEGSPDLVAGRIYEYPAQLQRIIDGDTVVVKVDLGFEIDFSIVLRLEKINTPEVVGAERKEGLAAKEALDRMIDRSQPLWVRTVKDRQGKYGRYLACLYQPTISPISLNEQLVQHGHAELYDT